MRKKQFMVPVVAALGLLVYLNVKPASGGPDTDGKVVELTARVEKLEAAVRFLAAEVDKLKEGGGNTQLTQPSVSIQNLAEIRKHLVIGASKQTIKRVLGEPERTSSMGTLEFWYYPNGRQIQFNTEDNTVFGWSGF